MTRGGVVLSHASTVAGSLVTECDDPVAYKLMIQAAQPGCVATPVYDDGDGWRSANGYTPEQIIDRYSAADVFGHNGFDHCQACFAAYQAQEGLF